MKLSLLIEFNFSPMANLLAKGGHLQNERQKLAQYPSRSGNLQTPVKPEHRGLMGQPFSPHATDVHRLGRQSAANTRPTPAMLRTPQLTNLGDPFQRGIINPAVGDDGSLHKVDNGDPLRRVDGPSETPGKQRWNSPRLRGQ